MSNTNDAAVEAAARLRGALDHLGDALAGADLDGLLAAESGLAAALATLSSPLHPPSDRAALAFEIEALQRSLGRCHRLGAAFEDLLRLSTGVVTPAAAYDRAGREREPHVASRSLEARF